MKSIVMKKDTFEDKYTFLIGLYEQYYKEINSKNADKLDIVYTPRQVVDFMIQSTDVLLKKHFSKTSSNRIY